jgi:hypothetical protein
MEENEEELYSDDEDDSGAIYSDEDEADES